MRERIAKSTCFVKARDLAFTYYRRWPEARRVPPRHCPWRLATAVRGLALCEIRQRGGWLWCRGLPRVGMTRRRALRGPGAPAGGRGRTETPPAKLSACATCHCARAVPRAKFVWCAAWHPGQFSHGHYACGASREGGEPPRAVAAKHRALPPLRMRGCTAHYSGGAMGTSRPTAITHARCATPLRTRNSRATFARPCRTQGRRRQRRTKRFIRSVIIPWNLRR